jgi:predicted AAA+ superfamily ATPase
MNETIKTILYEWKGKKFPEIISRETSLLEYAGIKPEKIIAITGFRRVGKTFLLLELAQKLLEQQSKEEIIYLNFEDERIPLKTEFLTGIIPAAKEIFDKEVKYLLLDEIQNIPSWSKWVRRIHDDEPIRIFVSGSSSKMSSKEIPTELRGRFLEVKVFPLSFKEFLIFKNADIDLKSAEHVKEEEARVLKLLSEYLIYGGLPEIVLSKERKIEIAQSYYQTVVRRDIIERYHLENEEALKATILLLINSKEYSTSKIYNSLKSMSYAIGKTTLQKYISCMENSYFLYSAPIYSHKIKDEMQYPRKIYFIDNVFITALSTKMSSGHSRLYENAVAVQLLKKYGKVRYWKSKEKEEVDFVIQDITKATQLIQVCYDLSDKNTKNREIRAILKASKELKCKKLTIITQQYSGEEQAEWFGIKGKIKYVPLWKWLLQQ